MCNAMQKSVILAHMSDLIFLDRMSHFRKILSLWIGLGMLAKKQFDTAFICSYIACTEDLCESVCMWEGLET